MSNRGLCSVPYVIRERSEYEALKQRGIDALFWSKQVFLEPSLRRELQEELFGKGNHQSNNQKFYRYAWEHSKHRCEECCRPLEKYSATYVSHIQSRGAHPESAYDLRNFNILCPACHSQWENGNREDMKIYNRNRLITRIINEENEKLNV